MARGLIGEATWSASGEGERQWFVGTLATIRVPGEAVGGRYALIEFLFPKHASPPRHTHPQDESYIVIDGHLTVDAGGQRFELETGGAATVPSGSRTRFAWTARRRESWCSARPPGSNGSCAMAASQQPLPPCPRHTHLADPPTSSLRSFKRTARSTSVHP
jgi:quercetin dioxygenase-like cupin family protein